MRRRVDVGVQEVEEEVVGEVVGEVERRWRRRWRLVGDGGGLVPCHLARDRADLVAVD